jgi:hypothetical protein
MSLVVRVRCEQHGRTGQRALRQALLDQTETARLRDRLDARRCTDRTQDAFHMIPDGLRRDVQTLSHLRGRMARREQLQHLVLTRAQRRRAVGPRIDVAEDLDEPEASDHRPVAVLQRDRADGDANAGPVAAPNGDLQLRVRSSVDLLLEGRTRTRQIMLIEAGARVEPSSKVAEELD